MTEQEAVVAHLEELARTAQATALQFAADVVEVADLAAGAIEAGGKLMFCGNGGSAADAQHLATEYVVRFRRERRPLPAIALTTDTSLLTAASNDYGFDFVFSRQVQALGSPMDLLFLHSTSGESRNLIEAARAASDMGVATVALLARDGGSLRYYVTRSIIVPTDSGARAQELHLALGHIICDAVERRLVHR